MPFLLAEILDFQGSAHLIGVGKFELVINMRIQSGTTEHSAFVIRKDSRGFFNI